MAGIEGIMAQYLVLFGIYSIIALSFNIEYGFGGIPNFGKVLFVSLGAYSAGGLVAYLVIKTGSPALHIPVHANGIPPYCTGAGTNVMQLAVAKEVISPYMLFLLFIIGLIIAAVIGAIAGIASSYPTLRLGGDFLAISLLALGEIVRVWAYNSQFPACSFNGANGIPGPFAWLSPSTSNILFAGLVLVIMVFIYFYTEYATNSPWGRALKTVRDDEVASEVYGYNVPRLRLHALAVGSAIAAIGGALLVFYSSNVNANSFKPDLTFLVIVATLLGGVANNIGILVGSAIIAGIQVLLTPSSILALGISLPSNIGLALPYINFMFMGVIIILVLLYKPEGLIPEKPLKTPIVKKAKILIHKKDEEQL
ncbi:MAG: branched-chain amino acid ABC transporter permease [Desulfurococcales archaeon]|nr:branched-chain amino acid ABC transporter permease [Desulfurococcales archaeon]